MQEKLEGIRKQIVTPILDLKKSVSENRTVSEVTKSLYNFLIDNKVNEILDKKIKKFDLPEIADGRAVRDIADILYGIRLGRATRVLPDTGQDIDVRLPVPEHFHIVLMRQMAGVGGGPGPFGGKRAAGKAAGGHFHLRYAAIRKDRHRFRTALT